MTNLQERIEALANVGAFGNRITSTPIINNNTRGEGNSEDTPVFSRALSSLDGRKRLAASGPPSLSSSSSLVTDVVVVVSADQKYADIKRQYAILDNSMRSVVIERDQHADHLKRSKFDLAKKTRELALAQLEIKRLQEELVKTQTSMTTFAAQARKDRDEAVSDAKAEIRHSLVVSSAAAKVKV